MAFKNSFKSTFRHLLRDKGYLFVNLSSLAVELACCLFTFKYTRHEWSYDRFHEDADHIFRIEMEIFTKDGSSNRYAILVPVERIG